MARKRSVAPNTSTPLQLSRGSWLGVCFIAAVRTVPGAAAQATTAQHSAYLDSMVWTRMVVTTNTVADAARRTVRGLPTHGAIASPDGLTLTPQLTISMPPVVPAAVDCPAICQPGQGSRLALVLALSAPRRATTAPEEAQAGAGAR